MWIRALLFRLMAVVVFTLLGLGVVELGIRLLRPQPNLGATVNNWDPDLGIRHVSGRRGFLKTREYDVSFHISDQGLRDREFDYTKTVGTGRILCLGDSFTFGYGVETDETFAKELERILARTGDGSRSWEVLNAGVGSTGTAHQYAYFQQEGHRFAPDIVVLCFFPGNDFADNALSRMFTLEDGELVQHPAPRSQARRLQSLTRWVPGYDTVLARSHLLSWIRYRVARWHRREVGQDYAAREQGRDWSEQFEARDALTAKLFGALDQSCRDNGARLLVAMIPPPSEEQLPDRVQRLRQRLATLGIRTLDLGPSLERAANEGTEIIFPRDRHWTVAGHRIVAQTIWEGLRRAEWLEIPKSD